jgi:1-acyl-sn-glycerol-3-phosphate acyltransferase
VARSTPPEPAAAGSIAAPEITAGLERRERGLGTGISPWLAPLAMVVTQDLVLPAYFRRITVLGREWLPARGPVLLAPTHKARWDALLLPHAAGRRVTGRDCRFMVTLDEMRGLQGWLLHRLGCFPVNQSRPSLLTLRYALDLLAAGEQLVVFPEGEIRRHRAHRADGLRLHQGLARLALMAASKGVAVPVLPVGIAYGHAWPRPLDRAALSIGRPLQIAQPAEGDGRRAAIAFTHELAAAMAVEEQRAQEALSSQPLIQAGHS